MTATHLYADELSVAQARAAYFDRNGFSDAGYTDRWVHLKLGPVPLAFPNTKSRQRAVGLHDLHHVATEYATTWTGEAEISAWELAAGCGRHWAAWGLDIVGFGIGLVIAPRKTYRAFIRGRKTRTLYRHRQLDPEMLDRTVGELRAELALDHERPTTRRDRLAFAAAVAALVIPKLAGLTLVGYLLFS